MCTSFRRVQLESNLKFLSARRILLYTFTAISPHIFTFSRHGVHGSPLHTTVSSAFFTSILFSHTLDAWKESSLWHGGAWINSTHIDHFTAIASNHDEAQYRTYSVHIGSDWSFFFMPTLGLTFNFGFGFPPGFLVLQSFFSASQHNISAASGFRFSCKQESKRIASWSFDFSPLLSSFFLPSFFTNWRSGGGADCIYVSRTRRRAGPSFRLDLAVAYRCSSSFAGGGLFTRQAGGLVHDTVV